MDSKQIINYLITNIHAFIPGLIGFAAGQMCPMQDGPKTASQPPGWVFGIVWTIMYKLIGLNWNMTLNDSTLYVLHWALVIALNVWVYAVGCRKDWKSGALLFLPIVGLSLATWIMTVLYSSSLASTAPSGAGAAWYLPLLLVPYLAWILFAQQLNVHIVEQQIARSETFSKKSTQM